MCEKQAAELWDCGRGRGQEKEPVASLWYEPVSPAMPGFTQSMLLYPLGLDFSSQISNHYANFKELC